jgi:hypothetical protein
MTVSPEEGLGLGQFETDAPGRAYTDACRLFIVEDPVHAEIALYGNLISVFELHSAEGACLDAFPASDARFLVDEDDPLPVSGDGTHGAGILAGRLCAVAAVDGGKIRGLLDDPYQSRPHTQAMLLFAGDLAGMTAHAVAFPKNKGYLLHLISPMLLHSV